MSETPRTDEREFAAMELKPSSRVVYASLARQLETELAEARAEIENLKWHINNEKAKAEAALELNDRALELVNEARAEIERLKSEHEDSLRRAKDNAVSLSGTVTEYAGELFAKGKLIEQMREALCIVLRYPMLPIELDEIVSAALAAERGE